MKATTIPCAPEDSVHENPAKRVKNLAECLVAVDRRVNTSAREIEANCKLILNYVAASPAVPQSEAEILLRGLISVRDRARSMADEVSDLAADLACQGRDEVQELLSRRLRA